MSTLLSPRPYLAVFNVTVEPDGVRALWVRLATRTSGVLLKKLAAGETHQPLLPWLESAHLQLPASYRDYRLVWGLGAGEHPTSFTLRHDERVENTLTDHLLSTDYLELWGAEDTGGRYVGPHFLDFAGAPVSRDDVDLVAVYPNLLTAAQRGAGE